MIELNRDKRDYSRQFVSQIRITAEPDDPLELRGRPKPVMIGTSTKREKGSGVFFLTMIHSLR